MLSRKTQKTQKCNANFGSINTGLAMFVLAVIALPPLVWAAGVSDFDITVWVKDALYRDVRIESYDIKVSTTNGIVTLSGTVGNLAAKKYADMETKKINGVLGVVNKITVSPLWRSDTDIRNAILRRILNDAVTESGGISVKCVDGKVTLSGNVASYTESQEAGLLASEVRGVKEVENNLKFVWGTKRSDQDIKNDIVDTLKRDVYLVGLPITVSVTDGVATLEGTVGSAYEKDIAERDTRWISNVKEVTNNLNVEWLEKRGVRGTGPSLSDADLKKAVRDELDQDARLNASDISIKASYGGITLDGTVNSNYEKSLAEQDVKNVVGVGWVTDNLFVHVNTREDWAILDDVKFNLNTDAITEGLDIGVKVKDGVVTLSGEVNTWYERLHAAEVASKVKGVKRVVNKIKEYMEMTRIHTGAMIAKDIKERFKKNWAVRYVCDQINVTVTNGVATLTGEVDTWAQYRQASEIAFSTEGVWKVDNRLHVKGYDYKWEDWYLDSPYYPWYPWSSWYPQ